MRPAALGIAYYCWVSRRKVLWVGGGFIALYLAVIYPFLDRDKALVVISSIALFFSAIGSFTFFFLFELGPNRLGYPRQLYTLPIPTRSLVFWPWFYCTVSLSVMWLTLTMLLNLALGGHWPLLTPCLLFAAGVACILAGTWAPFADRFSKGLCMTTAAVVSLGLTNWLIDRESNVALGLELTGHATGPSEHSVAATLLAWLTAAYLFAHFAVACDRRGDRWLRGFDVSNFLTPWNPRYRPSPHAFGSPDRAQYWYYSYGPRSSVGTGFYVYQLGLLALVLGFSRLVSPVVNPHLVVFGIPGILILGVSLMSLVIRILRAFGVGPPKIDPRQLPGASLESPTFLFLRPISGGGVAAALLRASLRNVLTNCLWWLSIALVVGIGRNVILAATGRPIPDWTRVLGDLPAWQCFGALVLSALAGVVVLWKLATDWELAPSPDRMWSRIAVINVIMRFNGLAAVGLSLLLDPATRVRAVGVFTWLGLAILAVKVLVAVAAFRFARRAGWLEASAVRDFWRCWLAVAVPALASAAVLLPAQLPVPAAFVVLWMTIFLPLGRLPLIALAFESNRHR
jgi:hypothetical protein